jgi:hypothetical protein
VSEKLVDRSVYSLAEYFLQDTTYTEDEQKRLAMSLAVSIQQCIEDWFDEEEA